VISGPLPISGNLYLGAGNNDISKATLVGTFTISHTGTKFTVTYTLNNPGYTLQEVQFFYGTTYPNHIAPGQFPYVHTFTGAQTQYSFQVPYSAADDTFIVHAAIGASC
jgi:hypothetical protein